MIKVIINPFLQDITFIKKIDGCEITVEKTYDEIDYWGFVEFDSNNIFHWHIDYDEALDVAIYKCGEFSTDYSQSIKRSIQIKYDVVKCVK